MSLKDDLQIGTPGEMICGDVIPIIKKAIDKFKKEVGVGDATDYSWIEMTEKSMDDLINKIFGDFNK